MKFDQNNFETHYQECYNGISERISPQRLYEDWPNLRCIQLLSTDVALDDFLDRKTEEESAESDRLSTILENSHEDSVSSSPQPSQTSHSELVLLAQYLLNEDPDLQEVGKHFGRCGSEMRNCRKR